MKSKLKKTMLFILAFAAALIGNGALSFGSEAADSAAKAEEGYIALYIQNPEVCINGEKFLMDESLEVAPYLKNGFVYVPLRFVAEALGGYVGWDAEKSLATAKPKNADAFEFSAASGAELFEGRTYVPADLLAKIFGKQYFYERGLIAIADEKPEIEGLISDFTGMTSIGSQEKLLELLDCVEYMESIRGISESDLGWDRARPAIEADESMSNLTRAVSPRSSTGQDEPEKSADYSETNTQVLGVDEADIIKTDGQYIYYVRSKAIEIVKANEDGSFEHMATFNLPRANYLEFKEIFVDSNRITAIGSYGGLNKTYYTQAVVINTENKKAPKLERSVEVKGSYSTSRKIGNSVYFAATHFYWPYYGDSDILPLYRDTAVSGVEIRPGYDRLYCFPDFNEFFITTLVGFNIDRPDEEAFIESIAGLSGDSIYMSQNALYIAEANYNHGSIYRSETKIYKFAADDGKLVFVKSGSAPGYVLNQFSMDEHKGYFRIATTKQEYGNGWTKYNNLYVFDNNLKIVGQIEDIAPGEQIYSARFMGDRAYMVTFKQVDPLFAIDLSDPENPEVLGALKIPGYSDYLHPYDENHLIGFGKDTVLNSYGTAYYTSMKISLFDVSDMTNPIEMFVETIGDRGTESELLQNHKALLFSKEKNLLAFPVVVYESEERAVAGKVPEYGDFKFAGAYVYEIDLEKGFGLRGKISHLSEQDMLKSSYWGSDENAYIKRLLTIKNMLYAASNRKLSSHSLETLDLAGEFYFEQ